MVVTLVAVVVALALGPGPAHAGQYRVNACDAAAGGQNWQIFSAASNPTYMTAAAICPSNGNSEKGLKARANRDIGTAYNGARAEFSLRAPADTTIAKVDFAAHSYRLENSSGDSRWSVGFFETNTAPDDGDLLLIKGCEAYAGTNCDLRWPRSGQNAGTDTIDMGGRRSFRFLVMCGDGATGHDDLRCDTNNAPDGEDYNAWMAVHRATVTLNDFSQPWLGDFRSTAFAAGWRSGVVGAAWSGADSGSGRHREWIEGGGIRHFDASYACSDARTSPCPTAPGETAAEIDTRRLPDGLHRFTLGTSDYSGNVATRNWTLAVDNTPPGRVSNLALEGDAGWRSQDGFELSWTNPSQGAGSPIDQAFYELCDEAGACEVRTADGLDATTVRVGTPGRYTVRVGVRDAAGRGELSMEGVQLRFDNTPVGSAAPQRDNGWVNADEAKEYRQVIDLSPSATMPPSGIGGYSVALDELEPDASLDVAGHPATYVIPEDKLTEGVHLFKARAVSGAGVASTVVGSTLIRVDRTRPTVASDQDAVEWHRIPTALVITGVDQEGLSGMTASDPEFETDAGAYIAAQVGASPVRLTRGSRATLTVAEDGIHTVHYYAVDVAGNRSLEREATVRVDQTAPELVVFEHPDPADPRRVVVAASDRTSGLASGVIELRQAGSSVWRALETRRDGERFFADLDDASLDPKATYELRARVKDVAGNETTSDRRRDGQTVIQPGAVRRATRIDAGAQLPANSKTRCRWLVVRRRGKVVRRRGKVVRRRVCTKVVEPPRRATTLRVPFGRTTTITGTLVDDAGRPIPDTALDVEARRRSTGSAFAAEGATRTDGAGRFSYTAPAGASRTLRFLFRGSPTDRPSFSDLDLSVPGALTLKANKRHVRNKQGVLFSGKVLGAPIAAGGLKVDLQVLLRGKWRTFATPRTTATGAFRHNYRFETITRRITFPFRAQLKPEAAYPYDLGVSRQVKVTVSGR